MDANSREQILQHLKKHPSTTALELSRALRLTAADVRYHLSDLVRDGIVTVSKPAPQLNPGRGRPARTFRLNPETAPDGSGNLLDALLQLIFASSSLGIAGLQFLKSLVEVYLEQQQFHSTAKTRSAKLIEAIAFLNVNKYQAQWEARDTGPRIQLNHCPYHKIIDRHPELCEFDRMLLSRITGENLTQIQKIDPNQPVHIHCIFIPNAK